MASNRFTLTEAVFWTKRLGVFIGIGLGILILIRIIVALFTGPQGETSKYLIADNKCGKDIPALKIATLPLAPNVEPTITLETAPGEAPDLPRVVNVYKYSHPGQSLNALAEATVLADSLGFPEAKRRKTSDTDYNWTDIKDNRQLNMNLENLNFYLRNSDYNKPLPIIPGREEELPTEEDAKDIAYGWLQELGLATKDLSIENTKVYFLRIQDGALRQTTSRQNADLVRVDFFRKQDLIVISQDLTEATNLGQEVRDQLVEDRRENEDSTGFVDVLKYPTDVVTNNPDKGNIYVTMNGSRLINRDGDTNLWEMEYFNWKLPVEACGTYELVEPEEALRQVEDGNGYLVKLQKKFGGDPFATYTPQVVKEIAILDMELVYLDTKAKQEYLQPVYSVSGEAVLGDNTKANIIFYVPALKLHYEDQE